MFKPKIIYLLHKVLFPVRSSIQVGLLNYPNSIIPDILKDVTSGTKDIPGGPYNYVPRYVALLPLFWARTV
jgi:hypothetical protein